jgi:hypothetical protein
MKGRIKKAQLGQFPYKIEAGLILEMEEDEMSRRWTEYYKHKYYTMSLGNGFRFVINSDDVEIQH